MCDKTCIFFFFPIINKYCLMAKRSLLSRCPSYVNRQWSQVRCHFISLHATDDKILTVTAGLIALLLSLLIGNGAKSDVILSACMLLMSINAHIFCESRSSRRHNRFVSSKKRSRIRQPVCVALDKQLWSVRFVVIYFILHGTSVIV